MNPLLQLVLSLSLGGSLMALLVLGLKWTLRGKLPSAFYYCAWLAVLLRLVLPLPGFMSLDSRGDAAPAAVYDTPAGGIPYVGDLPTAVGIGPEEAGNSPVNLAENTAGTEAAPAQPVQEAEAPARPGLRTLLFAAFGMVLSRARALVHSGDIWLWLWAMGAVVTLLWYILGYRRFDRALRRSLCRAAPFERQLFRQMGGPARLRLCRSAAVGTPMLLGLWRPVLVLPDREYSEEMLKNILRHELTHYRRGDLVFKWFAVLVSALHWFNPMVHIARRELDRACEMSCDERLLRQMDAAGKRSYGETLLTLAANSLPRRLVATSFATEKRNLKERLEQIMTYRKMSRATLALLLAAALLLGGCAAAVGPQTSPEPAESPAETETPAVESPVSTPEIKNVTVANVDELLSAIGSYTNITLLEGEYNLAQAGDYGQPTPDKPYAWQEVFSPGDEAAFELAISGVDCLTLLAEGEVTISAVPRYANVLVLDDCEDLCLAGLTIGHTEEPGQCIGGVVKLNRVDKAIISQCKLFGCGTVGVDAASCTGLKVVESEIYDCSYSAAWLSSCQDVLFNNCKIYDNAGYCELFQLSTSNACAIINCQITHNGNPMLLSSSFSTDVYFAGNAVSGNDFSGQGMFCFEGNAVTVEGCKFTDNQGPWYAETLYTGAVTVPAVDSAGNELQGSDFEAMTLQSVDSWEASIPAPAQVSKGADGMVHVSTVDEFLAAIASDTDIYLEDGIFDLSTASNYGGFGGDNYVWYDTYVDGPQLVISGVKNLSITGGGADKASIQAVPRYAEVLAFENCQNITLKDFTAGHTQAPGHCTGGVVYFANSSDLSVEGCSLYGCGVWGITLNGCEDVSVKNTEIYDCSYGDLNFASSKNIRLENCNIHDNGMSRAIYDCQNVTLDGAAISSFSPPDYETLNAQPIDLNPWEMPAAKFYINYLYSPVSELTLPVNTPIELYGRFWGGDADPEADLEVKWSLSGSDGSDVKLTERKHGKCLLENTGVIMGKVTLTAECQGQKASITVYLTENMSAAAPLRICFYEKELTEFTVRRGDAPVELNAQLDESLIPPNSSFTWTSSDPDCLEVTPNGSSCTVKILKARPEGVTLTCKAGGYEAQVTAYILEEQ